MKNEKGAGRVDELTNILEDCEVMEVTTMNWAPYYRKGDMLFAHHSSKLIMRDRVSLITRNGHHFLGAYIEGDDRRTLIQSFEGAFTFEHIDKSDIASVSKIIAAVYQ